jgi:glycosyltransferase involved in cell wall biosynthesis
MHIGIAGPIATRDVRALLDAGGTPLPAGCEGAPLLATIIRELLRRGHRVSAFTLSSDLPLSDDARVVANGSAFSLHLVPARRRAWPPNGRRPGRIIDLYAFERRGLQAAIESVRPDVIHAHWAYEFAWAALRTGLPHLVTCHDSPIAVARFERDFRHGAYRWLRAAMAWHVLRNATRVTTVSPYMVEQLRALCRSPVQVVGNPISDRPQAAGPAARSARLRVLMVCNGWGTRKNGDAGLRAYALLRQRLPGVELHLYGRGTEQGGPAWHSWRALGMPGRACFHGAVSHDEVLDAMAAGSLMLHPALEESFGAVLAEAMSAGMPVVAGRHSGAVPWVVGDGGELVDVTRPEAMADAMLALLLDPAGARARAGRGRDRMRAWFSPSAVAVQYEREYEAVLAAARAGVAA